jgi:CheY-like chemotaxis protein
MDTQVRGRIFEPFYTTKDVGQGTGLGLAIVYGVVKNHDGFIAVESEPGQGSSFRLYFPVIAPSAESPVSPPHGRVAFAGNGAAARATILVAEDETPMADLLEKLFRERGHRALMARDGEEALRLFSERQHELDAVLLDVGLPKLSGCDVIAAIKAKQPDAVVIVASGYLAPEIRAKLDQLGVEEFVDKPYVPQTVLEKVQSLATRKRRSIGRPLTSFTSRMICF